MKKRIFTFHFLLRRLFLASMTLSVFFASATSDKDKMEHIMQVRYGANGVQKLHAWRRLLDEALNQHYTATDKIKHVNDFFNAHTRFADDIITWKQSDYWATPLETLGIGAGDCEDYTIAKYMSLLQLGIPTAHLRLIYVKAQIGGPSSHVFQAHMVLGYYPHPNAIPFILDSLLSSIEPADKRTDLHPVFSFNSDGLWVGGKAQPEIDPTARLSRWRDVLMRMKQEGF